VSTEPTSLFADTGSARANGTLVAYDDQGRSYHFTDYVQHGETVDMYATLEDAQEERGGFRRMVVKWCGDEWVVEPADV